MPDYNLFAVTHTQRFTDYCAQAVSFIVDGKVSPADFLCSRPSDYLFVSKDKVHSAPGAAEILTAPSRGDSVYSAYRRFLKTARPKSRLDKTNSRSVRSWNEFKARCGRIRDLLRDPDFREYVGKLQASVVGKDPLDALTRDQKVAVAPRMKQIILPTLEGDLIVSPLHPLSLSFYAGGLRNQQFRFREAFQKRISKLDRRTQSDLFFAIPFVKANSETGNFQTTGIPSAGKAFARMRNFPPPTDLRLTSPLWLDARHSSVAALRKAIQGRHAYVIRRGGTLGNTPDKQGVQFNNPIEQRYREAVARLVSTLRNNLENTRNKVTRGELDVRFVAWPEPLCAFLSPGSATPEQLGRWPEFFAGKVGALIREIVFRDGSDRPDDSIPLLYDDDRKLLDEALAATLEELDWEV